MFKLDFKHFKKIGSDQHSTTLQHPEGHTIKIAHASIHPRVREQLAALPMHKGGDPTQEHLLPGDKLPNSIEKEVVSKARQKLAGGGMVNTQQGGPEVARKENYKKSKKMAEGGDVSKDEDDQEPIGKKIGYPGFASGGQIEAAKKTVASEVPYADGGGVNSSSAQDSPESISADAASEANKSSPQAPASPPVVINVNGGQQPSAQPAAPQPGAGYGVGSAIRQGVIDTGNAFKSAGKPLIQGAANVISGLAGVPPEEAAKIAGQAPETLINKGPEPASNPPASAQPNLPPQTPIQDPLEQSLEDQEAATMKGFAQKEQGIQAAAQAMGQQGQEEAKALDAGIQAHHEILNQAQDNMTRINGEIENVIGDIKDQHIDPNHYWNDKSTLGKVSTALGMILSGWGSGISGQPNMAVNFLNANIDRDINAQKANLGKQESLLSAYYKEFGNVKDAEDMARITQQSIVTDQLKQAAATAQSPLEKARALQAIGQLNIDKTQAMQQFALRKAMMSAQQSNPDKYMNYLRLANPQMAKEMESRYVPGVGMASVPIDPKAREEMVARDSLQKQVSNLRQWAQQHSGDLSPADVNYGKALANSVQDAYRRANGQGVFREAESNFVKGIVEEDPTKFFNKLRVDPKYKALEDSNLQALNGLKAGYGLPVQNASATPQVRTMGGVRYQKVPGGWKKIQ